MFDSVATAVRAACPGVALGDGPNAPRVTLLLYTDDVVILADNPSDLQNALTAVGIWGSQWRFSFGICPDKAAVLVHARQTSRSTFSLPGDLVLCAGHYCYLGVVFQASRKWQQHAQSRIERSTGKFHQSISWAENRGLCTNFRSGLTYLLILKYGCQFLDVASIRLLDQKAQPFGRRLLRWPWGAPGAAVVGEMGWPPMSVEVRRLQLSLFGRLSAAGGTDDGRTLARRV